jgi:hypothetical protein
MSQDNSQRDISKSILFHDDDEKIQKELGIGDKEYSTELKHFLQICVQKQFDEVEKKMLHVPTTFVRYGFCWACRHGELNLVKILLNSGILGNTYSEQDYFLSLAAKYGHLNVLRYFLDHLRYYITLFTFCLAWYHKQVDVVCYLLTYYKYALEENHAVTRRYADFLMSKQLTQVGWYLNQGMDPKLLVVEKEPFPLPRRPSTSLLSSLFDEYKKQKAEKRQIMLVVESCLQFSFYPAMMVTLESLVAYNEHESSVNTEEQH